MAIWFVSTVGVVILNNVITVIHLYVLCHHIFSILLGIYLGVELLSYKVMCVCIHIYVL